MGKPKIHNPVELGNDFGHIKFGHISPNSTFAGVLLRNGHPAQDSEHYTMLMSSGKMKGGTINRCPGVYQIICGENPVDETSFVLNAALGDIVLRAPKGRIRMDARNIDIIATGSITRVDISILSLMKKSLFDQKTLRSMVMLLLNFYLREHVKSWETVH